MGNAEEVIEKEHIDFLFEGDSKSGKTEHWGVIAKDGAYIGEIKWYASWRKYVYYPEDGTLYDSNCMDTISEFIKGLMGKRR